MPASITIALVALSPKVIGNRIEMPASGPMPGSTPTSVPTTQPRNAYHSTAGCSATEKPRPRAWMAAKLESQYSRFERRLARRAKPTPGDHRQSRAVGGGAQNVFALDDHQQGENQQRHCQDEAERLIKSRGNACNQHDEECVIAVAPVDLGERCARLRANEQRD